MSQNRKCEFYIDKETQQKMLQRLCSTSRLSKSREHFHTMLASSLTEEEMLGAILEEEARLSAEARFSTGILATSPLSPDIKINSFTMTYYGTEILKETNLAFHCGKRYGLIGVNGCGKSTLMSALGNREIPLSNFIDIFHIANELIPACNKNVLQCVIDIEHVRDKLVQVINDLSVHGNDESQSQLLEIYSRLDDIAMDRCKPKAFRILIGLGFTRDMQKQPISNFTMAWRMRVALARALLVKPHLLLLDEPTNFLDMESLIWLVEELRHYPRILIIISNSMYVLNSVCTDIIHMDKQKLRYYEGNYEAFVKQHNWIQYQEAYLCQSNCEMPQRTDDAGDLLTEMVNDVQRLKFNFPLCGEMSAPLLTVQSISFRYNDSAPWVFKHLEFDVFINTRVALLGRGGKSTLLQLLNGELTPTFGLIHRNYQLRVVRYHQGLQDKLNLDLSPIEHIKKVFPEVKNDDELRIALDRFGIQNDEQRTPMRQLSDGQRCRVIFAWLAWHIPHLMLLDEPTQNLDMETVNALAEAINRYDGAFILVTHDHRLISLVAHEFWVCDNSSVMKWDGNIQEYREYLRRKIANDMVSLRRIVRKRHAVDQELRSKSQTQTLMQTQSQT